MTAALLTYTLTDYLDSMAGDDLPPPVLRPQQSQYAEDDNNGRMRLDELDEAQLNEQLYREYDVDLEIGEAWSERDISAIEADKEQPRKRFGEPGDDGLIRPIFDIYDWYLHMRAIDSVAFIM